MLPASWFKVSQPLPEFSWIRVSVASSLHQAPITHVESHQGDLGTAVDIQITSASGWSSVALDALEQEKGYFYTPSHKQTVNKMLQFS